MKKRLVSSIENVNHTYEQEVEAETEEEAIEKAENGDRGEVVYTDCIEREEIIAEEMDEEPITQTDERVDNEQKPTPVNYKKKLS